MTALFWWVGFPALWTVAAAAVAPWVGRCLRDGQHADLIESQRTAGPAGRRWSE